MRCHAEHDSAKNSGSTSGYLTATKNGPALAKTRLERGTPGLSGSGQDGAPRAPADRALQNQCSGIACCSSKQDSKFLRSGDDLPETVLKFDPVTLQLSLGELRDTAE